MKKTLEHEAGRSAPDMLPPPPWSASNQYGMKFILSNDNRIILRADHLPMDVLKAMVRGANQHFFSDQRPSLSAPAGSVPPTAEELYKALDDLHIACECAIVPDVEEWYRGDLFASEARQNAIDALLRYHHSQNAEDTREANG